jgi:hypothetical protein
VDTSAVGNKIIAEDNSVLQAMLVNLGKVGLRVFIKLSGNNQFATQLFDTRIGKNFE